MFFDIYIKLSLKDSLHHWDIKNISSQKRLYDTLTHPTRKHQKQKKYSNKRICCIDLSHTLKIHQKKSFSAKNRILVCYFSLIPSDKSIYIPTYIKNLPILNTSRFLTKYMR